MKNYLVAALAILLIAGVISSCKKEGATSNDQFFSRATCTEADDTLNTYNQKIKTIFNANCVSSGCHNASSKRDGKDFSSYAAAKAGFESNGLCSVYQEGCEAMPDGQPKLSDSDLHDLNCWVQNNYPQ